ARQALRDIAEAKAQARGRCAVACVLARLGDPAEALRLAETIDEAGSKHLALATIARAQAAAGQKAEALRTVDQLKEPSAKIHGLYQLALGQAKAGDKQAAHASLQRAIDLAKTLPEGGDRGLHFHNIASAQAET